MGKLIDKIKSVFRVNGFALAKSRILRELGRATMQKLVNRGDPGNWDASIILYWHARKTGKLAELDAATVPAETYAKVLRTIVRSNKLAGNPVCIQGDLSELTLSQWLALELALVQEKLKSPRAVQVSARDIESSFDTNYHHVLPSMLRRKLETPEFDWKHAGLGPAIMVLGILTFGFLADSGLIDFFQFVKILAVIAGGLWLALGPTVTSHYLSGGGARADVLAEISDTWDSVFKLERFEDALLLGLLNGFTDYALQMEHPLPDFLKMTPKEAMQLIMYTFNGNGLLCKNNIECVGKYVTKLTAHGSNTQGAILYGVDLTSLRGEEVVALASANAEASAEQVPEQVAIPFAEQSPYY